MKRLKRILFLALAVSMATILSVNMPIHAAAEDGKKQYIEDLVVIYGSDYADAKQKLEEYGNSKNKKYYPVDNNTSTPLSEAINVTSDGEYVLVGYSITTNKQDAITDISTMNMLGAFDFDKEYEKILQEQKDEMHVAVQKLMPAFELFADNYEEAKKGNKENLTTVAYSVLEKFYNDDIIDAETNAPVTVAKMITNADNYTDDQFDNMFMQMSGLAFITIERYLLMGCITDWIYDSMGVGSDAKFTAKDHEKAQILLQMMPDFQENIAKYKAGGVSYKSSKADITNYLANLSEDADKQFFIKYGYIEGSMDAMKMKDGRTLLDIFMLDTTDANTINALLPIAYCIDDDLTCLLGMFDLADFYVYGYCANADVETIKEQCNVDQIELTSVYAGVDRSIYDANGVGVTDSANKSITSSNQKLIDEKSKNEGIRWGFFLGSFVSLALAGTFLYIGINALVDLNVVTVELSSESAIGIFTVSEAAEGVSIPFTATMGGAVFFTVVGVIFLAAFATLLAFFIIKTIRSNKIIDKIRQIPKIMVDSITQSDGSRKLTYYYCVKDANGNSADLNKYDKLDLSADKQWSAIYYTKDAKAGNPLTADRIALSYYRSDLLLTDAFLPVHLFGETVAYDTRSYNPSNSSGGMFFGFSRDTTPKNDETIEKKLPGATSVVDGTTALFASGGIALGALLGFLGVAIIVEKNKRNKNNAT